MSCFVMNPEPLAALANTIAMVLYGGYNACGFEAPKSLYDALRDCHEGYDRRAIPGCEKKIYERLYAVNVRAYNGRYGDHEEPEDETAPEIDVGKYIIHRPPKYRDHGFAVQNWHYYMAKLLDCWLYQVAEDATMNDPLRLALEEFQGVLCGFIVRRSQPYTNIQWGELPPH